MCGPGGPQDCRPGGRRYRSGTCSAEGYEPAAKLGCGIGCAEDCGGDGYSSCSGSQDRWCGLQRDAGGSGEDASGTGLLTEMADAFGADGGLRGLLGGGGIDGADGEVICRGFKDAGQQRVRAAERADDPVGAKQAAGFSGRGVSSVDV